jgi:hypothetical protein
LQGHYAEHSNVSQNACFAMCSEDFRCAAACCIYPDVCRLFKYGFERADGIVGSTAYVKPEVVREMAGQLGDVFPNVRHSIRFTNEYDLFDTLTPSQCFRQCNNSKRCGGASFTTDNQWVNNCYLYKTGQFQISDNKEGIEFWTSFTKAKFAPKTTTTLK